MKIMSIGAWDVVAWYHGVKWNKPSDTEWIASLALFHSASAEDIYPCVIEIAESLAFDGAQ